MRYVWIALLFVASTAGAEDWQQIAELDSNGSVLLVNAATIAEVKGFRKAWFKSVYTSDQPVPVDYQAAVRKARSYRWLESMNYFSCPERTTAVTELRWHGADDELLGNFHVVHPTVRTISPGTPDERMLETVCKAEKVEQEIPLEEQARLKRPVNPDDYYPTSSGRRGEEGSPIVRVCVDASGKLLRDPVVTDTSGFPALDAAAVNAAKDTRYSAGMRNGTALPESCLRFKIKFLRKP